MMGQAMSAKEHRTQACHTGCEQVWQSRAALWNLNRPVICWTLMVASGMLRRCQGRNRS